MAQKQDLSNSLSLGSLDDKYNDENLLDDDEPFEFLMSQDVDLNNIKSPVSPLKVKPKNTMNKFEPQRKFERTASLQVARDRKLSATNALKNPFIKNSNNLNINTGENHVIHNFQSTKPNNEQTSMNFKIKRMSKGKKRRF